MPRWTEVPLVDGSYSDDAKPWSVQECINYISVAAEQANTMSAAMLRQLPGSVLYANLADANGGIDPGPIRGMHNVEGQLFVVAGTKLFEIRTTGAVFVRGTIPGTERTRMAHNQITNGFQLAIPTGSSGYVWDTTTNVLTHITDDGFTGAITFDFIDNYITYVDSARNFAGTSELADALSYNTLDRYDPEASPDKIVGQIVSHQQWWLMSTRTIEPYDDTGQNTGTFQRAAGAVIDQGLASPWAVVNLDNTVMWLGSNGFVYRANGYTPVRVSTHAIEQAIARCDKSRAFSFTWEDRGHSVFYLTFPDGYTLGYDCGSGKWHRRLSYGLNRWRMNDLVSWNGGYYGGDFASGKVYALDWNVSDEAGQIMERRRTTGVLYDSKNPVIVKAFELVFDTGQPEVISPLTITGDMPDAIVGSIESVNYIASGGFGSVSFSFTGTLPPGMSLSSNGMASGQYNQVGTFNFTVIATDLAGTQASIPQTVVVANMQVSGALGNQFVGIPVSFTYGHLGGVNPLAWTISSGSLPTGLSIGVGGLVTGTPTTNGTYSWIVRATDAFGNFADHPDSDTISTIHSFYDPTVSSASLIYTNDNQTIHGIGGATSRNARANIGHSTGKWYFEVFFNNYSLGHVDGVVTVEQDMTADGNDPRTSHFGSCWGWSGIAVQFTTNGPMSNSNGDGANNAVRMIAVDLDAGKMWCGYNGVWSQLPGVDPAPCTTLGDGSAIKFPATWIFGADSTSIRMLASEFTYAPPAGFNPWWIP